MTQPRPTAPPDRSPHEQAKLETAIRQVFEQLISFNRIIGVKVESLDASAPVLRFDMKQELLGNFLYGRLHGGVIASALDTVAGLAIMCAIAQKHAHETTEQILQRFTRIGTVDMRTDYLHPGTGKHFVATASVNRLGGRIASTQMRLENDGGQLIATGVGAYVIS